MTTLKNHIRNTFTTYEIELLKYFYRSIFYDLSKFLLLLLFYSILGLQMEFCIEMLILLSIRNFYGGIHFQHYSSCFMFTFIFSLMGIILAHTVLPDRHVQLMVLVIMSAVCMALKPVTAASRPELDSRKMIPYRICGACVLLLYITAFIMLQTFPYSNLCFWVIVLHTLQLIAAKLLRKGENKNAA